MLILPASPAQAASYPVCNEVTILKEGGYRTAQPVHKATGSRNCELYKGTSGEAVERLQLALVECYGYNTGGVDGIFGDLTHGAVWKMQDYENIGVDGRYGPQTRKAMKWPTWNYGGIPEGCREWGV
ncbi:peptidoglycan-binding domain-containing protein [Streptomyces pseudoechinosporeus]